MNLTQAQLLRRVSTAAMTVKRTEEKLAEARAKRDALIRQAVADHAATVAEVATLAGLSRQKVYETVGSDRIKTVDIVP